MLLSTVRSLALISVVNFAILGYAFADPTPTPTPTSIPTPTEPEPTPTESTPTPTPTEASPTPTPTEPSPTPTPTCTEKVDDDITETITEPAADCSDNHGLAIEVVKAKCDEALRKRVDEWMEGEAPEHCSRSGSYGGVNEVEVISPTCTERTGNFTDSMSGTGELSCRKDHIFQSYVLKSQADAFIRDCGSNMYSCGGETDPNFQYCAPPYDPYTLNSSIGVKATCCPIGVQPMVTVTCHGNLKQD